MRVTVHSPSLSGTAFRSKYLAKSFRVFYRPLKAGLQPAAHCRRVANPSRAMLENLWASTYMIATVREFVAREAVPRLLTCRVSERLPVRLYQLLFFSAASSHILSANFCHILYLCVRSRRTKRTESSQITCENGRYSKDSINLFIN